MEEIKIPPEGIIIPGKEKQRIGVRKDSNFQQIVS